MQNIKTLYVIAMDDEAKDIINETTLIQEEPFRLYKNGDALLAITKIGKVNASFVLSNLLTKYNVQTIVNIGFAGANGDYQIGEAVLIKEAQYHDFDLTVFGYELGQVPNFPTKYFSNPDLMKDFTYKQANLYTGDYFMTTKDDNNYLVDMEATALFQVAHLMNKPMIVFKVVSDIIGKDKHLDEYNNFEKNGSKIIKELFVEIKHKLQRSYKL